MKKEERFWNWFKENNSKYFYLNQISDTDKKEKLLNHFLEQLHQYCDGLFFEIGGVPNESQELIISAEGDKNYFHNVEELVAYAPKINDWQIIAFKPPMGIDFIAEYEGVKLNPKETWFLPLTTDSDPKIFGIKVCFEHYTKKKHNQFLNGAYQILDVILGEKSNTLDIQHVEVDKLPQKPEDEGLIELSDLQNYIEWRKSNKT